MSYTGQTFDTVPEASSGVMVMSEEDAESTLFDARTVKHRYAIKSKAKSVVTVALDLVTLELVWIDAKAGNAAAVGANVINGGMEVVSTTSALLSRATPLVGDILRANITARGGVLVDSKEDADEVFDITDNSTHFDYSDLFANWV